MAAISQTIPNYVGGISEQPDYIKALGTVKDAVNVVPDVTYGLFKRLGAKRIGKITPSANDCHWFHYYRSIKEGSYIGQIDNTGAVKMWRTQTSTINGSLTAGAEVPVVYKILNADNETYTTSGAETVIKNYLKNQPGITSDQQDAVQTLTINDTTFALQKNVPAGLKGAHNTHTDWFDDTISAGTGLSADTPHKYFAYVELKKTENGRQYGLDIGGDGEASRSYTTATRIDIKFASYPTSWVAGTSNTGHCPHVATRVFSNMWKHSGPYAAPSEHNGGAGSIGVSASDRFSLDGTAAGNGRDAEIQAGNVKKHGLTFRFTVTGQQGISEQDSGNNPANHHGDYGCTYTMKSELLHGGIGWLKGDTLGGTKLNDTNATTFDSMDFGNTFAHYGDFRLKGADYWVDVQDHETYTANILGGINPAKNGFIRPAPTPFDADTATPASAILGGIKAEIDNFNTAETGYTIGCDIIGNGLYIYSNDKNFNVKVIESDLMRVISSSANDVTELPNQCKHGYIVKIENSQNSQEDDYYLKFEGTADKDGPGSWVECLHPAYKWQLDPKTMPVQIQRTAENEFTVSQVIWGERPNGDNDTNPRPAFVSQNVEIGSDKTDSRRRYNYIYQMLFYRNRLVLLSGSTICLSRPNDLTQFWRESATVVGAGDPIDIGTSKETPQDLVNGVEINAGLVVFSQNEQFLLSSSEATVLNPDTAKTSHLSTYFNNNTTGPLNLGTTVGFLDSSGRQSKFMEMASVQIGTEPIVVDQSKVIPRLIPNDVDIFGVSRDNNILFIGKIGTNTVYGYRWYQVGQQRLLSAWFKWKFSTTIKYFFVSDDTFYFIDNNNFLQRINFQPTTEDLSATQDGTTFDMHIDNWTTITGGTYVASTNKTTFTGVSWLSDISGVTDQLVILKGTGAPGRFAPCTVDGTTITVDGNWSADTTRYIGYLYDMEVDFPKFYPYKQVGDKTVSDVNASLVIHRIKLALGRIGSYTSTITRTGKDAYTDLYEQTVADSYEATDAPYDLEEVRTIPIYEKNSNIDLSIKSTDPSPAVIRSLAWEGDYTTKNYQRV